MRNISVLSKRWIARIQTVVSHGIHVLHTGKAWMLLLLLGVCLLVIGELQSTLQWTILGYTLDLVWLSRFILTSMATFVTVSELIERRHKKSEENKGPDAKSLEAQGEEKQNKQTWRTGGEEST